MFRRKLRVSLLNEKWEVLMPVFKVETLPRIGEFMWWSEQNSYFKIINIVHNIYKDKLGIFIVLEKISMDDEKKIQNT